MVHNPPSSDSEPDVQEYQYESDGEEMLGTGARALLNTAGGDYRLARAALLAYTRNDLVYVSPTSPSREGDSHRRSRSRPATSVTIPSTSPPLLPTQSRPHGKNANRARFLTPPPTPGVSSSPPPSGAITGLQSPTPRHLREGSLPREIEVPRHCPAPVSREECYSTAVYPLVAEARLLEYFGMEYSTSVRSPEDIRKMLKQIKSNQFWLGDISYVDTSAVNSRRHEVQKPAANALSRRWYCVTKGTEVGIFTSWSGAAPCVSGVSQAAHHSSDTKQGAYSAFQYALILGTVKLLPCLSHP